MIVKMLSVEIHEYRDVWVNMRTFEHITRHLEYDSIVTIIDTIENRTTDISYDTDIVTRITEHAIYETRGCGFSLGSSNGYDPSRIYIKKNLCLTRKSLSVGCYKFMIWGYTRGLDDTCVFSESEKVITSEYMFFL